MLAEVGTRAARSDGTGAVARRAPRGDCLARPLLRTRVGPPRDPRHRGRRGRDRAVLAPGPQVANRHVAASAGFGGRPRGAQGRDRPPPALPLVALPSRSSGTAATAPATSSTACSPRRSSRCFPRPTRGEQAGRRPGEAVAALEERVPKVAQILEQVEAYILAFYTFPAAHCPKLRSSDEIVKHPTPAE